MAKKKVVSVLSTAAVSSLIVAAMGTTALAKVDGLVVQNTKGEYVNYDLQQLKASLIEQSLDNEAPLFEDFTEARTEGKIVSYHDDKVGFVDAGQVSDAATEAFINEKEFELDTFTESSKETVLPAKVYQAKVADGKVVKGDEVKPNTQDAELKVESVSAINTKSLKVSFNTAVDTTKANFKVQKSGITLNVSKVTFADDKKSATLELSTKLTKGEYVVNISGASEKTLTSKVAVENEKVSSIEILSDLAVISGAGDDMKATVAYKVTNQYGEDITKTTSLKSNIPTENIDFKNGVAEITLTSGTKVGDKLPITLINVDSAVTATKVLTLSAASTVSEVSVKGIYNKDGKTLNEDTNLKSDKFYLLVDVKDQYGNVITNATTASEGLIKAESNPSVVATAGDNSEVSLTPVTIDGKKQLGLQLEGKATPGEAQITLISTTNGKSATAKISVAEARRADVVTLSQPSSVIAGEDLYIPVSVLDKQGKAITDTKILNHATKGVKVSIDGESCKFEMKDKALYIKVEKDDLNKGIHSLVAQSSTYKVATLTLNVKEAAKPTLIRGLKSTVSPTLLASEVRTISLSDLVMEDQYGRVMDEVTLPTGMKILVKDVDSASEIVTNDSTAITNSTNSTLTAGTKNGTEKFQFVLCNGDTEMSTSTAEVTFRVTDGTEYKSYEVDKIGTVYDEVAAKNDNDVAYDKAVNVYGVLNDGSKVKLTSGTDFAVTSTNSVVNADLTDGTLNVNTQDESFAYGDKDTLVAPITVTINANGQQFTQNVTFSKVAPKVEKVSVLNDDDKAVDTIKVKATKELNFGLDDLSNIAITDQYGVPATVDGTLKFADGSEVTAPRLTIQPVKGTVTINHNGLDNAEVTGIDAGEEFNVTLTYAGNKSTTVKVIAIAEK